MYSTGIYNKYKETLDTVDCGALNIVYRTAATSMDSLDTALSPNSLTTRGADSYDDYELGNNNSMNRKSFSSDISLRESLSSNIIRVSDQHSPRSSFTTVDDQYDYFRSEKTDPSIQSITRDLEALKFSQSSGNPENKVNSLLFADDGNRNDFRAKIADKGFIGMLKAASEDAYDSSHTLLKVRKSTSQDTYDHLNPESQLFPRNSRLFALRGDNPIEQSNESSAIPHRRESFPFNKNRQGLGVAQLNIPEPPGLTQTVSWQNQGLTQSTSNPSSIPASPSLSGQPNQISNLSQNQAIDLQSQMAAPPVTNTNMVYQVQFKRKIRHFVLGPLNQQMEIHVGDYVKVEADRGEDLGVVQGIITVPTYLELRRHHHAYHGGSKDDDGAWDLKHILRMASTYERRQLPTKAQEEVQVVQNAFELARNVYGLPMTIIDAEFQFDHHKLVIYYESNKEFVRDLFALYKTRIWMQQVDHNELLSPMTPQTPSKLPFSPQNGQLPPQIPQSSMNKGRISAGIASVPVPTLRQPPLHYAPQGYVSQPQYIAPQTVGMRMQPNYIEPMYVNQGFIVDPTMQTVGYAQYDEQSQYDQQIPYLYSNAIPYTGQPLSPTLTSYPMYSNSQNNYYETSQSAQGSAPTRAANA